MAQASWKFEVTGDRKRIVYCAGEWTLSNLGPGIIESIVELSTYGRDPNVYWDLTQIEALDSAGALILWRAWGKHRIDRVTMRPEHESVFVRLAAVPAYQRPRLKRDFLIVPVYLGEKVIAFIDHILTFISLLGRLVLDLTYLTRHKIYIPWREISANVYKGGARALSVTALVGFMIGIVVSYLSALQLESFGANAYIINLLGYSIIRELGPVLAAVLIAGRSGSAMTAQLGVMRVTEEIDALQTMGISRSLRLVLPKVIAMGIAMPLVVLWTMAMALLGGMVAATIQLDIDYMFFLNTLPKVVPLENLWIGLSKGFVFGLLIALIACHYGLRIRPNTESLSASTTSSVVASITTVILVDGIFAVMTKDIGF